MSEETKPWYLSKGILGSLGAVVAGILTMWIPDVKADDISNILIGGGGVAAGILALIGRIGAKKTLTS